MQHMQALQPELKQLQKITATSRSSEEQMKLYRRPA
jgi:membrane protein insertase Oxa1/YidC/SpoIIIJ